MKLIKPSNCILYLPLQGDANDRSGNGNNFTVDGTSSYEAGIIGQCMRFDASGEQIHLSDSGSSPFDFEYNSQFSIAAWVMKLSGDSSIFAIMKKNQESGNYVGWYLDINNATIRFGMGSNMLVAAYGGERQAAFADNGLAKDTWFHIAATKTGPYYQNANLAIYINGKVANYGSTTYTGGSFGSMLNNEQIESGRVSGAYAGNGKLSHIMAWNTDLSAKEVSVLFNSQKGAFLL